MNVDLPNNIERFVDANGRLTLEGIVFLQRIIEALRDHEARLVTGGL